MVTDEKTTGYKEGLAELRKNLGNMLPPEALSVFDTDAETLETTHQSILKLKVGDKATDFSLTNAKGDTVTLSKILESDKAVVVFYRGTWCPYCNLQLAHYQNSLREIHSLGAKLAAISPQTPDESLSIAAKNELDFEVLSDNGNIVARNYTTVFENSATAIAQMTELGFDFDAHYSDDSRELPVPAVFVIAQNGTITFAKAEGGDYRNRVDVSEIRNALK